VFYRVYPTVILVLGWAACARNGVHDIVTGTIAFTATTSEGHEGTHAADIWNWFVSPVINPRLVIPAFSSEVCIRPAGGSQGKLVMLIWTVRFPLCRTEFRQLDFVALRLRDTEGRS